MSIQEELLPTIKVHGIETNVKKFVAFLSALQYNCSVNFEDGNYIYAKIRENMLASMKTEDIALYHYELSEKQNHERRLLELSTKKAKRSK